MSLSGRHDGRLVAAPPPRPRHTELLNGIPQRGDMLNERAHTPKKNTGKQQLTQTHTHTHSLCNKHME